MRHSTALRIRLACILGCMAALIFTSTSSIAQTRPDLGTASTYAIFTGGGAINNTGLSVITGDIGQDGAYQFTGFPPGTYTGTLNRDNAAAALALSNLETAQTVDGSVACGTVIGVGIVDGQQFTPGVYCAGGASTTTGNITFNAQGNGSAIFIVKIDGALSANAGTHILLANNARAANIYWFVGGAVNIAANSSFTGTIIAIGAITFLGQSSLNGRALTSAGAINISANNMAISTDSGTANNLTVVKPAAGDTILGGTLRDSIKWTGTGIATVKTLQYSLDSGVTWTTIATINNDSFVYIWHVPDTTSTKAMVRVTDTSDLRGVSGIFMIVANKIIVTNPVAGAIITEGTLHDTITWTGSGLTATKTFAYSLDSGVTWITIGKDTSNGFSFSWNVPDTVSTRAMIRITDSNGVTGKSGVFTILSNKSASIVVITPALAAKITEGTQNYQITWSGTGITPKKTFSLSLDSGVTWTTIGAISANVFTFSWNVPDTVSTRAMIRITDSNGVSGKSGVFSITSSNVSAIVIVTPAPGAMIVEGTQNYQITWTGANIAAMKTLAYSLDKGVTWTTIGAINASVFAYGWNVPDTTSIKSMVRIIDGNSDTGKSGIFIISKKTIPGSIVIVNPATGEIIAGGKTNYQIVFTDTNVTAHKTLEYSLDGGADWNLIAVISSDSQSYSWANVPNVATNEALVRITDSNGVTGTSGLFTITLTQGVGSINSLTLTGLGANSNIGNNETLGISWTFTPDVGDSVVVEYSTDNGNTWIPVDTLQVSDTSTTWQTPLTGYDNPVYIRVISSLGMTGTSIAFSIGSLAFVAFDVATSGYSVSNYPNPVSGETTTINFELPIRSDITFIVSDNLGRQVSTVSETFDAGTNNIPFNTSQLADGVYTYTLVAGSIRLNGRMSVVR